MDHFDSLGGAREAGKDQWDSLRGTREAGKDHLRQPGRHQGGSKALIGQPARHQGGTREAGEDQLDSPEAPGRQERTNSTAWEATKGFPVKRRDFKVRGDKNVGSKLAAQLKGRDSKVRGDTNVGNRVISLRRMQQPAARG